ncbi:carbon starvation protein A [Puniceicoccales bacterium CK1056]|uniref:Carbon starvation protein A n=1 Tax=Oceanipulchritudo coccoides TaxID=2706888 RepID=A0A6B2M3J3_9BACT|nr:carbon starvation CstA family protein [Oceanipulchritudo coccoides]NDV63528.1 carbon starvation protein A [Oceanipulchritudo coccoides]
MITLLLISLVFFAIVYRVFGTFMDRRCGIDDSNKTPAHTLEDGVDYVPTRASILFGHHFSSIAGAGPIVGPILAAMYFGWGPTWLWILIGAAFVGGIHDYGAAFISTRTGGKSIAEAMRSIVGKQTGRLFALFVLLALIYVIIVFLDLTASTFTSKPEVATASGWFIFVALGFGLVLNRTKLPFLLSIAIFVPVTYAGLAIGHFFPAPAIGNNAWAAIIIVYCFIAAILPVQLLLQPRDFLSSTFLYVLMAAGILGVFFSSHTIQIEAFTGWNHPKVGTLVPILFITVACGACSGFHSIVSSGTTSKQLSRESDIKRVNYGAMLVEGVVAVFALGTIAILSESERAAAGTPVGIFASGTARFMSSLGLPQDLAMEFTLLAVSTFLLTTLDTCTRLSRFILEEFLQARSSRTRWIGTAAVLILPAIAVTQTIGGEPAWKAVWPLFGATNQLMAALALLTFMVFLKSKKIRYGFVIPAVIIMVVMPLSALALMAASNGVLSLLGGVSAAMFLLGGFVTTMSVRYVLKSS